MNARKGNVSTTGYTLRGKTLAEIDKEIDTKGPRDPNESARYAGSCLGKIDLVIGSNDLSFETQAGKSPLEVKATLKGGTLTSTCQMTLPKLASEKVLTPAALKEWKRFRAATERHEDGHADSYFALAETLAGEASELSAVGKGKDEKAAKADAQKAMLELLKKTYGGTVLSDRIKAAAKAYDKKTNHGVSQGAVLKTSIV